MRFMWNRNTTDLQCLHKVQNAWALSISVFFCKWVSLWQALPTLPLHCAHSIKMANKNERNRQKLHIFSIGAYCVHAHVYAFTGGLICFRMSLSTAASHILKCFKSCLFVLWLGNRCICGTKVLAAILLKFSPIIINVW